MKKKTMEKKTKWIAVFLCFSLFAIMALGSGSSDSGEPKDIVTTEGSATSSSETTEGSGEVSDSTSTAEEAVTTGTKETIENQVLMNQDGIVITATEYTSDSVWGDGIKLLIENSTDKNVMVGCTALIVNDYMITDLFESQIAAGKKSNETMYLSSSELEAAGIDSVGKIETYFHVYDSDSFDEIFTTDVVTIQTSEYANMDATSNDAGTELYNAGGVRIVGKTVDEDSFWGSAILLYIENTSGTNVGVQCDNVSINGFMMTPYFSSDVYNGKKAVKAITILSSDLEANGITSIDDVELQFHIYNVDTFETIADSDPITFSAQ